MVWPFEFDPELLGSNPMIANFFGFFQFLGFVNIYWVFELLEGQPKKMHMRKEWTLMIVKAKEPKHEPKQIVIDFSLFCGLCRCLDCCYGCL